MKALTVRQPFASAIVHGSKRTENRPKPVSAKHIGATIALHAGLEPHASGITSRDLGGRDWPDTRGAGIGLVRIVGHHQPHTVKGGGFCCPNWGMDTPWHWDLADVRPLKEPIPCTGALSFWTPPKGVLDAVTAQLAAAPAGR